MSRVLKFSTPDAGRCFTSINTASQGFEPPAITEAASNLLAMTIAHGSVSLVEAEERIILIAAAIARDIRENWPADAKPKARLS